MDGIWLIDGAVFESLDSLDKIRAEVSTERIEAYQAAIAGEVSGKTAVINIRGVLTDSFNMMYAFFGPGSTTYKSIQEQMALALNDSSVENIRLDIASPGGQASADWLSTMEIIKNSAKPVTAVIGQQGSSAAYGLAVSAGKILAQNALSSVGSIGVVASVYKKSGGAVVVTSSNAPDKVADPESEAGISKIRARLDEIESIFIERVAQGRNVSTDVVKSQFGRGDTLLANEALKRGMIDGIANSAANNNGADAPQTQNKEGQMDLQALQKEYPAVYAEAVAIGVKQEKDRVSAHLTMAEASGDMSIAVEAIKSGDGLTDGLIAKHHAAKLNKQTLDTRSEAEKQAAAALAAKGGEDDPNAKDFEDKVAEATAKILGLDVEGGE